MPAGPVPSAQDSSRSSAARRQGEGSRRYEWSSTMRRSAAAAVGAMALVAATTGTAHAADTTLLERAR
ncbi:hypothetical protein [Streptomyces sp. NPDC006274]|uniref:hypothetical protein n=1 Tax=unclassified Streptomyces TaxID=2593676 RepID=UPI0033ADED78